MLKMLNSHCFYVNHDNINNIIIGDSIVAGPAHYNNAWKHLFGNGFINLGIRGYHVEYALQCVRDIAFPQRLKNVVILRGTNNINKESPIKLFKDWLPLVHLLKTGSITPTYLFVDYFPAMNAFLIVESLFDELNDLFSL